MDYLAIRQALEFGSASGEGGALFAEARNAGKWEEIRNSPFYCDMVEEVREEGQGLLSQPFEVLPFSSFKLFDTVGSRIEFERLYFARRKRLSILAFLSMLDDADAPEYLEALEDTVWAICDEYTWCLPAHLGGNSLKISDVEHRFTIDLFAAETGFALAEIVSLLKDRLNAVVAHRAEKEVRRRILDAYSSLGSFYGWETVTNNWASVCGGSVGAAALYLISNTGELASIIHRLLGTMESYLKGFEIDGACTEGVGYWTYGFGFFVYFANLLKQRTAGKIDLLDDEKVKQIALFHQKSYLSGYYTVPFSDCELTNRPMIGLIHSLKNRYPEVHVPEWRSKSTIMQDRIGRWAPFIRDFIWSRSEWIGEDWPDDGYFLPDAQWFVSRRTFDGERIAFAAKGGHNSEPHNHNDIGSFVLHIGGETLLADIGSGEYTKAYFGQERYSYLCNSSRGHSVPIVEGSLQQEGAWFRGHVLQFEEGPRRELFSIDMTKAYANPNLRSLTREFALMKEGSVILEMKDTYLFEQAPSSVIGRFITQFNPVTAADGRIRIQGVNSGVDLLYDNNLVRPVIQCFDFVNKDSLLVQVYALDLEMLKPSKHCVMRVRFQSCSL